MATDILEKTVFLGRSDLFEFLALFNTFILFIYYFIIPLF